jgi:hypothetical protein
VGSAHERDTPAVSLDENVFLFVLAETKNSLNPYTLWALSIHS